MAEQVFPWNEVVYAADPERDRELENVPAYEFGQGKVKKLPATPLYQRTDE